MAGVAAGGDDHGMTRFSVDPEQLVALAVRLDALASDLGEATTITGLTSTPLCSGRVEGALSGFVSHQADGLRALHASLAGGARRVVDAAGAYRAVDDGVSAAAGGR
jgi:hypothetical protein